MIRAEFISGLVDAANAAGVRSIGFGVLPRDDFECIAKALGAKIERSTYVFIDGRAPYSCDSFRACRGAVRLEALSTAFVPNSKDVDRAQGERLNGDFRCLRSEPTADVGGGP